MTFRFWRSPFTLTASSNFLGHGALVRAPDSQALSRACKDYVSITRNLVRASRERVDRSRTLLDGSKLAIHLAMNAIQDSQLLIERSDLLIASLACKDVETASVHD